MKLSRMQHSCRFHGNPTVSRIFGKIRKIKDFTKRREQESLEPFPTHAIFDLAWPFHYRCRSEEERKFLAGRIRNYAYSHRRGKFKLPSRFSDLVDEVSNMSRRDIRSKIYLVTPELSDERRLLSSTFDLANRVLTRCLWNIPRSVSEDCARRVDCHRLSKTEWPRNPGSLWPSSPSVPELIVMSRSGKVPERLTRFPRVVNNCPTVQMLRSDRALATRVVSDNVIGIRSSVQVPRKFLPWFRYRNGILFLTVRYSIPIGLVRFLLGEWKRSVHNLWLRAKCHLKYYLRLVPHSGVNHTEARSGEVSALQVSSTVEVSQACSRSVMPMKVIGAAKPPFVERPKQSFRRTQRTKLI